MCGARLGSRLTGARTISKGVLSGYRLAWHKRAKDGSGKCDAFATGKKSDLIVGVLYDLADSSKETLDRIEGVGHGYNEQTAVVADETGLVSAVFYCASEVAIDPSLRPFDWYKEHVVCGAIDNDLPPSYVADILAVEARIDKDTDRSIAERRIRSNHRLPPG
jgi:gamma-glutamylcyclotransferase